MKSEAVRPRDQEAQCSVGGSLGESCRAGIVSQETGDHVCASDRPEFKFWLLTVPFAVCLWVLHCIFLRLGFFTENDANHLSLSS